MNNEFIYQLKILSDKDLISRFNSDVRNPGWVSARSRFLRAIRNVNYSKEDLIVQRLFVVGVC